MRTGDLRCRRDGRGFWLRLWLCCVSSLAWGVAGAAAPELSVRQLADDPPAAEVLSGAHDHRLDAPPARPVIQQKRKAVHWWRIDAGADVGAETSPRLVLRSPFLYRIQAWVPGASGPAELALYGAHADDRYSHRALIVELPEGMGPERPVWLRIVDGSAVAMPVSLEPLDQVHREDLVFVAWRAMILSVLSVLVLLALAFWVGTGDRGYGYFGAMLVFAIAYLASIGGDLRGLPYADAVFGGSPQANRFFGGLGVVFSNLFQRSYLDLGRRLPVLDRLLWGGTVLAGLSGGLSLFVDHVALAAAGNVALMLSAMLLLVGSGILALRGDRPGRVVVVSWAALMAFTTLAALEMMGVWVGPTWLGQGLAGSFALAGLLLTIGLADKLLQLRRDRDQASRQAQLDTVTKLLNRHGIEERLFRELEAVRKQGRPLSIAFVDVDHFKSINDRHGHSVGDQCLRIVSWRLRNQLRRSDALGRYGGDEFLVVLPDCAEAEVLAIAERMRVSVNCRPLTMAGASLAATLSIGIAELERGESMDSLFERADTALYASKAAGRDRVSAATPADGLWNTPLTENA